jgi:hypothetical protein
MTMLAELKKYMGYQVEIIYIDRYNKLSHRFVYLRSIKGDFVQAYCFQKNAPRMFKIEHILAISKERKRTG